MNYFKHSPLPKLASNRLRKVNARNPNNPAKRSNERLETLDIMQVYAQRKSGMGARWAGGDEQDRLDYVKEQKAKVKGLDRVLNLSSKRMTSGHRVKSDAPFLEFTDFDKEKHTEATHL